MSATKYIFVNSMTEQSRKLCGVPYTEIYSDFSINYKVLPKGGFRNAKCSIGKGAFHCESTNTVYNVYLDTTPKLKIEPVQTIFYGLQIPKIMCKFDFPQRNAEVENVKVEWKLIYGHEAFKIEDNELYFTGKYVGGTSSYRCMATDTQSGQALTTLDRNFVFNNYPVLTIHSLVRGEYKCVIENRVHFNKDADNGIYWFDNAAYSVMQASKETLKIKCDQHRTESICALKIGSTTVYKLLDPTGMTIKRSRFNTTEEIKANLTVDPLYRYILPEYGIIWFKPKNSIKDKLNIAFEWRLKTGVQTMAIEGDALIATPLTPLLVTVSYDLYWSYKLMATYTFSTYPKQTIYFKDIPLTIYAKDVGTTFLCVTTSPELEKYLVIKEKKDTKNPFNITENKMYLKTITLQTLQFQCELPYAIPIKSEYKTFYLFAEPTIVIKPRKFQTLTKNRKTYTCDVSPESFKDFGLTSWVVKTELGPHVINPSNTNELIPSDDNSTSSGRYACRYTSFTHKRPSEEIVFITASSESLAMIQSESDTYMISQTFVLSCIEIPEGLSDAGFQWSEDYYEEGIRLVQKTHKNLVNLTLKYDKIGYVMVKCRIDDNVNVKPRKFNIQGKPKLYLADDNPYYLKQSGKVVRCVAKDDANKEFTGRYEWIDKKDSKVFDIMEGSMIISDIKSGEFMMVDYTCKFYLGQETITRDFVFYILDKNYMYMSSSGPTYMLHTEDCSTVCQTNYDFIPAKSSGLQAVLEIGNIFNNLEGFVEVLHVELQNDKQTATCTGYKPDKNLIYACYAMRCSGSYDGVFLKTQERTRCYINYTLSTIADVKETYYVGDVIECVSTLVPRELVVYSWFLFQENANKTEDVNSHGNQMSIPPSLKMGKYAITCQVGLITMTGQDFITQHTIYAFIADIPSLILNSRFRFFILPGTTAKCEGAGSDVSAYYENYVNENAVSYSGDTFTISRNLRNTHYLFTCKMKKADKHIQKIFKLEIFRTITNISLTHSSLATGDTFRCYATGVDYRRLRYKVYSTKDETSSCPLGNEDNGLYSFSKMCAKGNYNITCLAKPSNDYLSYSDAPPISEVSATFIIELSGYTALFDLANGQPEALDNFLVFIIGVVWSFSMLLCMFILSLIYKYCMLTSYVLQAHCKAKELCGKRVFMKQECDSGLYIVRGELEGQENRRLRDMIGRFDQMMRLRRGWEFIWCTERPAIQKRLLSFFLRYIKEVKEEIRRDGRRATYKMSVFLTGGNTLQNARMSRRASKF